MEIPILTCLKHISIFIVCYVVTFQFYRRILHPEYRWHQKGNVCWDEGRQFSFVIGSILIVIIEIIMNIQINVTLN